MTGAPTAPGPCPVTALTLMPSPVLWDRLPQRRMLWWGPPPMWVCACAQARARVCVTSGLSPRAQGGEKVWLCGVQGNLGGGWVSL